MSRLLSAGLGAVCLCLLFSGGCAHRSKTPFDHLYGPQWCQGVYKGYAEQWDGLRMGTEIAVRESYGVLTREGVSALDRLQSRSTPFYVLADPVSDRFVIRREVPDRLMFTADMSAQDRDRAQTEVDASREHIASDYSDVKRLEWALNGLLDQLARVGIAMQNANREMFNIVQIRQSLREGELPFELPYQVTVKQYDDVLLLVEVADSSLGYDRSEKAGLYAAAGVADYWVVNARDGQGLPLGEADSEGIMRCPESGYRYREYPSEVLRCLDVDEDAALPDDQRQGSTRYRG